jgi:hypothetical protein
MTVIIPSLVLMYQVMLQEDVLKDERDGYYFKIEIERIRKEFRDEYF